MEGKPVVTRFAPSPTGYLHIGGARTALFNWLYARHCKGKMLLRIEDTDAERHNEAAVKAILDGLQWLGLSYDGEMVRQATRAERHAEVAYDLMKQGKAYKCYCSKEKLDALREQATAEKKPFRYPGICRDLPADYVPPEGTGAPTIRLKIDREGATSWDDKVQGTITMQHTEIDDLIILRANGTAIYILAVVVDDHDMEVTNVIRGSDHITNTARQICIYDAAGWDIPTFAHIPLIFGSDGKKLSKRHGATGLEEYEALGYFPEAMRNYLTKLGWGHGNDDIFTTEQAIEWFDMNNCTKSPACFDFPKLDNINAHYLRECEPERLLSMLFKIFPDMEAHKDKLLLAMDALKPRAKTLVQFRETANFLIASRPLSMDKKAEKIINDQASKDLLGELSAVILASDGEWNVETIEHILHKFAEDKGQKIGKVAQPLRAALTGTTASPGIYEVLCFLGKKETLDRIQDVL